MAARSTRYFVSLKGKTSAEPTAVDVETLGEGQYALTINGNRHEISSLELPHGAVSMLVNNDSYAVEFEEIGDNVAVLVKGYTALVDVADDRKIRLRAASKGFTVEGKQVLAAPMPGKVVKVFVKVGDQVTEGQGLVVVEAMKMENELKSPKAGKVIEVVAIEGTAVENGAKLLVVE